MLRLGKSLAEDPTAPIYNISKLCFLKGEKLKPGLLLWPLGFLVAFLKASECLLPLSFVPSEAIQQS